MLIDINQDPAKFVGVVCPNGDETDAEFAFFQGGGGGHDHDH